MVNYETQLGRASKERSREAFNLKEKTCLLYKITMFCFESFVIADLLSFSLLDIFAIIDSFSFNKSYYFLKVCSFTCKIFLF